MNGRSDDPCKGSVIYGRVIDGSLNKPVESGAVVFEGERIKWVGQREALPPAYRQAEYRQIDLPGRSVMPGLIDGHMHISFGEARSEEELALYTPVEYRTLKAAMNARKVLQAGVTSAFDAATTYNIAPCLRDAIDAGLCVGPRLSVCGRQLTTHQGLEDSFPNEMQFPPGQAGVLVKGRDEIVEAIRYQVKDRVDAIKVSGSNDSMITPDSLDGAAMTAEEFEIIAQETHRLGKIVAVHARSRDSVIGAAAAGFDLIFHASYIDNEGIDLCLKNGVTITPTLTLLVNLINANNSPGARCAMDALRREVDAAQSGLAKAYEAGVPFIAGSETGWSPVPYGEWHAYEAELFVTLLGFTPLAAIHACTLAASRCLKRFGHEVGKLEAGRYADILVVNGNPASDITVLQRRGLRDYVFKGGVEIDLKPQPPPRVWHFERHKMFLDGYYRFDESLGRGVLRS
jgi:imidazolonepropionase-like amidohydrolase